MYFMRLDDASVHMNIRNWRKMESVLDHYGIRPIFGIIPHNEDSELRKYPKVKNFWKITAGWMEKGWTPAMHGYSHRFETNMGGLNPVNLKSEFAGLPLERQREKIRLGMKILEEQGIRPEIFFAPAHTFDIHTLDALELESDIRVISDTIASDIYRKDKFYFLPQQTGRVRRLPFRCVTFCYHPNIMSDFDFNELDAFLSRNAKRFICFQKSVLKNRNPGIYDSLLKKVYFMRKGR